MKRILTGIQSTNQPHLGNILGAIDPMIQLSQAPEMEAFAFIADLHALTTVKDGSERRHKVRQVAATWIACGFDVEKNRLYCQSDIPEITELTWYLNCFTPFPMLANAHSFKDKSNRLSDVNAGLFTYPVLMAADILGYDAHLVPVGKDQLQHLEMTRDIAASINHTYGDILVVPEARVAEDTMLIPGTDGQKMSKSYGNFIDVFLPEKDLKKVLMSVVTDSTPLEDPKDAESCIVYQLFKLLAPASAALEMRNKLQAGGYGYGHAKNELLGIVLEHFGPARMKYHALMENTEDIESILAAGAERTRPILHETLSRVRRALGFSIS
ncbi:MAG: tryptophan--tRNA ligase [Bacteroidetes bacterium]|jgi:tryptophanyl-tRNA synthetase|nr:tryptophan--tRNA ligase [Bacteroidota bacterium]MDA0930608.1 tryptophan--tRNA ligase [Bacteroidota bacterium]